MMDATRGRVERLGRGMALVTGYALVAGLVSIAMAVPSLVDGDLVGVTRAAIGAVGVVAALLVLSGRRAGIDGWQALVLWGLLQLPVWAERPGGNLSRQLFEFPVVATSSRSVNGDLVSYSAVGVNLAAIALLLILARLRPRWESVRREGPVATGTIGRS